MFLINDAERPDTISAGLSVYRPIDLYYNDNQDQESLIYFTYTRVLYFRLRITYYRFCENGPNKNQKWKYGSLRIFLG